MGVNKEMKVFGQKGIGAVSKEMQQFHDREVIIPKNPIQLTKNIVIVLSLTSCS